MKSFWGSAETAHFPFLVAIPIPFGIGKLAQERTAFAQKRNKANFNFGSSENGSLMLRSTNRGIIPTSVARLGLEVPLDATET